jgi:glutamyl-Q tRNA(Asp) synthetase
MTDAGAAMAAPVRYRGRFAPSPTGPLHFGSLIAAMASYADALASQGEWLVRIEDVDLPRVRRGAADDILRALERLGFEWQGNVWLQSNRTQRYAEALEQLRTRELTYPCVCTRSDRANDPVSRIGERVYPRTCASSIADTTRRHAIRVRVNGNVSFVDRHYGAIEQSLVHDVGDFILRRSDRLFAYQLAVVVDDADQRVTDVVRGADLLASTPRQIFLQRALGFHTPRYLHVPVAIDAHGNKLSKQTHARPLPEMPVPALLAAWHFLDQLPPTQTPTSVEEFWRFARRAWQVARLPPVSMLPAPAAYN